MVKFKIIVLSIIVHLFFIALPSFAREPGVTDRKIVIGTTTSLKGPLAFRGEEISRIGAQAYFNYINEQGGVHGRKIENIIYDDEFKIAKAVQNVRKLVLTDQVFCLFSTLSTNINLALVKSQIIQKNRIPLFSPITLFPEIVRPLNRYIFSLYPDIYTQAQKMVNYAVKIKKKKVCVLYHDNRYGYKGLDGVKVALEKKGLPLLSEASIKMGETDFQSQIARFKSADPDTVVLFTYDLQSALFIKQAKTLGWTPQFIGASPLATKRFIEAAEGAAEGAVVLNIIPNAETSMKPGVVEYRNSLKKYFPGREPSNASLLGYTSAKVLAEGLSRAGRDLTREGFIKALETGKKYETNIIYPVIFTPEMHLGTKCPFFNKVIRGEFIDFKGDCTEDG